MAANTEALSGNQPADPNIVIWRYMDLSKFIDLLSRKELYLAHPNSFSDPFEGLLARNHSFPHSTVRFGNSQQEYQLEDTVQFVKEWHYVNCWHANEHESAAMWKLYAKSNEAVAIKTTYQSLVNLLPADVQIAMVRYFDYDGRWAPPFGAATYPLVCKRKSFEHEREVRLVYNRGVPVLENREPDFSKKNKANGVHLPINVSSLIDEVFVSPDSPGWYFEVVSEVIDKFGYSDSFEVKISRLAEVP